MAADTEETLNRPPLKPEPEAFEPPVSWLFGRQFIANLKWILLYTAFKGKLDARDWMKAEVIPAQDSPAEIDQFWRAWNENPQEGEVGKTETEKEFWFDYISDTGDGQKAMYSIAYLCLSDLTVSRNPQLDEEPQFVNQPDQLGADKMLLPRGTFLFVGGDTSYHISDYGTLANRFQNPFWWAIDDLKARVSRSVLNKAPRLLFGIPGNHDYYDSLDGFNRQFRQPATGDKVVEGERTPQLMIPTFRRQQESSFLALRLPFDWWFWGLDMEGGEIDFRQLEFFKNLQAKYAPQKLIVATPAPTTVFGKYATEAENQSKTFAALGLERPFLKNSEPLGAGKCRVDLAGDVHHYARYWGPRPASGETGNYASVMAGGGGAFFHPTQTNAGEVPQQVLYPAPGASRAEVADQIFKLRNIWNGGWVWLFGGLIAISLYFAASFPQSSKTALDTYPLWVKLGISPQTAEAVSATYWETLRDLLTGNARWKYSLLISIIVLGAALGYSAKLFAKEYDPERSLPKIKVRRSKRFAVWLLVLVAFVCLAYGLWGFYSSGVELSLYSRSMIILVALVWSVLAVIESVWYSEWLFEEAYATNIKAWHYWPIWILLFLALVGFGAALWFFGKHEAAFLISDLVNLIVLLGVGGGLVYFAYGTGAQLKGGIGKLAFVLLGVSHALLQLAVTFLMVRKGHLLWATLAIAATVFVFKYVGRGLAKLENGWPLVIAWIALGGLLLGLPFVLDASYAPHIFNAGLLNMPDARWLRVLLCLWAGVVGAVMSCVLFGWYLAVSLAFNGHNNEAGGAARIEGFKELIRFRINREGLTGYVIAFDQPETDGSKLKPKLVDVFHLCAATDRK